MIIDTFTYFNEEEILKIRLNEIGDYVDHIVIVEAWQTFTGDEKPLYLKNAGEWIQPWQDKIIHVVCSFPRKDMTPWEREHWQRNSLSQVIKEFDSKDRIILSDVDEIPRVDMLELNFNPRRLDVKQYFWNPTWQVPQHCNQGARPVSFFAKDMTTPQEMRSTEYPAMPVGGWHFSFFTSYEDTVKKIEAFAHSEYDKPEYKNLEHIKHCMDTGLDPFNRFPLKKVKIDKSFPRYIVENYGI